MLDTVDQNRLVSTTGQVFIAQAPTQGLSCIGCAFDGKDPSVSKYCIGSPCLDSSRSDKRSVIFVEQV